MADQINLIIEALNRINASIQGTQSYIDAHSWDFVAGEIRASASVSISSITDATTVAAVFTNSKSFVGSVVTGVSTNASIISDAHTKFYATSDGVSGADGGLSVTTQFAGSADGAATTTAEFTRSG